MCVSNTFARHAGFAHVIVYTTNAAVGRFLNPTSVRIHAIKRSVYPPEYGGIAFVENRKSLGFLIVNDKNLTQQATGLMSPVRVTHKVICEGRSIRKRSLR